MIGLEETFDDHLENLLTVFREVRRVLRHDGTLWLNYGDAYVSNPGNNTKRQDWSKSPIQKQHTGSLIDYQSKRTDVLKPKDLMMMPARVAMALQCDGWWLRSEIIWGKKNPMPESVTDRPTSSHEKVFLFAKSSRYFYDHIAVRTPIKESSIQRISQPTLLLQTGGPKDTKDGNRSHRKTLENFAKSQQVPKHETEGKFARADSSDESNLHGIPRHRTSPKTRVHAGPYRQKRSEDPDDDRDAYDMPEGAAISGANMRNFMHIATHPYRGSHFATFPPALIEPFIKAGTSDHGCCSECGAPWVREVDKSESPHDGTTESQYEQGSAANRLALARQAARERGLQTIETLGWKSSCECDAEVVPCTVMDCFGGSGTTALVADRLQRDAVLIEISDEYADMARRRIQDDAGMFTSVTVE